MNEVFAAATRRDVDLARASDFGLGAIDVQPSRRRLIHPVTGAVEIEPRVMKVLVALHRAGGDVLSRDDLIDLCWGGRIVGDDALNRCIVALRRLSRGLDPPPFEIETIPRVGYRLVIAEGSPAPPQGAPAPGRPAPARPRRRAALAATVLAGLAALLVAGWTLLRGPAAPPPPAIAPDPTAGTPQRREAERLHATALRLLRQRTRAGYAEAETLLRRSVALDPTHAPSWAQLGVVVWMPAWWAARSDPRAWEQLRAEATGHVRRALAIDPRLAEAHAAMGLILVGTGGARRWLEQAVRLDPDNIEAWMWLGNDLVRYNELRRALDAYGRAVALDPGWQPAVANRIVLLGRLGRRAQALVEIELFARRVGGAGGAHLMRGGLLAGEGRLTEAGAEAAAMLAARSPDPWRAQAMLLDLSEHVGDAATRRRMAAAAPQLAGARPAYRDPATALRLARANPDQWWQETFPGPRARHLLAAGEGRLLVVLYDRRYGDPARLWEACLCPNHAVAPPLILALRDAGRAGEAQRLRGLLAAAVRKLEAEGDRQHDNADARGPARGRRRRCRGGGAMAAAGDGPRLEGAGSGPWLRSRRGPRLSRRGARRPSGGRSPPIAHRWRRNRAGSAPRTSPRALPPSGSAPATS